MKIAIISDTHDNLPNIKKAVEIINDKNTDLVIHAGDYVSPFTAKEFKELSCEMIGVFGNNDGDRIMLLKKFEGIAEIKDLIVKEIEGRKIFVTHGVNENAVKNAFHFGFDIVIFGHTHKLLVEEKEGRLLINPGELCGYLTNKATFVILDLKSMKYEVISL